MKRFTSHLSLFTALCATCLLGSCSSMTPEQQAQWTATGNAVASQASGILLDEAAARLKESRKHHTADAKDAK